MRFRSSLFMMALCAPLAASAAFAQASAPKHTAKTGTASSGDSRTSVSVLPVESTPGDSIHTIIARDLDYSDRIHVASSGARASAVVRAVPSATGLTVSLLDPATQAVRQQREFALPVVVEPRDRFITDSLDQMLVAASQLRTSELARASFLRDSIRTEIAKKPPKLRSKEDKAQYARIVVQRDSVLAAETARDAAIYAAAKKDTLYRDDALRSLLAHERFAHDSLATARRWAIHGVADEVARWVTGQPGIAQSRVAYVAGGQVRVVDFDGANDHAVTTPGRVMSPAWRHDGRAIVYSDMTDAGTQISWVDLSSGAIRTVDAAKKGLNITPVFSPDNQWVVFAKGDDARTGLVAVRADSANVMKSIDANKRYDESSPAFSPDGVRVAYVSPRPKTPQIYSSNLDGTDERLETPANTPGRIYRTGPDWSPDGSMIAFEQQNGDFQVWLVNRASHQLRKLTSYKENEDPTWSPDSRHLAMTSTRGGARAIWILDVQTGHYRQLTAGGDARLAAWSPRIGATLPEFAVRSPATHAPGIGGK